MTVTHITGGSGRVGVPDLSRAPVPPLAFSRCTRVVAVAVQFPEFVLAAAGIVQRLGSAGIPIDLLELSWRPSAAERAQVAALSKLQPGGPGVAAIKRHRLALPTPFGVERTPDVLAAMCELIGFDPEPGVICLVPGSGESGRSAFQAVEAATEAVVDAYRLRVVRYSPEAEARTVEIDLDDDEWQRKRAVLATCAPDVALLSGRREYLAG